ncbi:hypothetical protein AGR7C_Lc100169 [Agrobacterium deltaense Zutra 3/1]|uniref:Tail fiber protein n=1 Tax=Agrobacterium deltaense Zutra 3/1 TaxID=1183427 RepID=A0A1S7QU78_9HYPH|nr:hypothetical protein [Agrobacterium deltaense]CUX41783.1 hypothetical protein AGR7C_Lc100169 [Agrobacterium deltaense Zutra 3/1]
MTALYTSGTISLVNGSAVITGIDTAWKTALIVGGTVHVEAEGNPLPILPDDSAGASEHPITDTEMTAAIKWQGATGTYKYALVRENTYTEAQAANSVKIAELLQRLNHPTIAAIAGVQGEQDHLILLTGASTATVIPRTSLIQGIEADATVETPAGLVTYESEAAGFIVLVSNAGDERAALYFKISAAAGDWSDPAFLTGEKGDQGDIGPTGIRWAGVWNNTDAYAKNDVVRNNKSAWIALRANTNVAPPVLPTEANDDWELFAPAGMDGAGTGDFLGPAGGVAVNQIVGFADNTGKLGKGLTTAQARVAALVPIGNYRNKLINPLGAINQRAVTGTVTLAAGAYGHDRFKAGASGCTYTFATSNGVTTFTITAGSLQQVIEAAAFAGEPGTYFLSWSGTAQGRIGAGAYDVSGAVSAVCNGSSNVTVEFGIGTVSLPQIERDYVTDFSSKVFQDAELCLRYYFRGFLPLRGIVSTSTTAGRLGCVLPVQMRIVPAISLVGNVFDGGATAAISSITGSYNSVGAVEVDVNLSSSLIAGRPALVYQGSAITTLNAEL